ncbi:phosphotransferase RcsD [Providencia rustigianii]|uniref:phosphotransferase RcsD n=1 Tax=Providencia rustigianii TaxID=158850 RepID=UPI000F6ED187|nr:phosphotransferase RcsD [Providencia rustigianii]MTC59412.1 phosphotransferase RcsD [Providencia rustigianii]VEH55854.1 Sensor-like histidine kinase RcsD [Providencia rustigianii]
MYKQSLLKSNTLSRIFIAFVFLLVATLFLSLYNFYHAWMQGHQTAVNTLANRLAYQIEDYRYQASQIYKLANDKSAPDSMNDITVTEVRNDMYWLSSANQTIDSVVFGINKPSSKVLASKLANYMEIVWGARNEFNSMYYLNGQDNTLVLVTTHSILKPELRYKESYLTLTAEDKRADMISQSTLLDRREIISNVQKNSADNVYYYTYRLVFNSPGRLSSVISFDISVNSILPFTLQGNDVSLSQRANNSTNNESSMSLVGTSVVLSKPVEGTNYQVQYNISLRNIIFGVVSYNLWLIICIFAVAFLAMLTTVFIRKRVISPNATMLNELRFKDTLNNDIISHISYGILVYDFNTNKKILSNSIANQLFPSMDLNHIKEMATEHNDIIQVSIENNVYEIILVNSAATENIILFIIIDKDKELLTQKRQEMANREYQRNIQLRKIAFENICSEILPAITHIDHSFTLLADSEHIKDKASLIEIQNQFFYIHNWFKNIELINQLEAQQVDWKQEKFSISHLISQFIKQNLIHLGSKGLGFYFYNRVHPDFLIEGSPSHLRTLFQLVWDYAIETTAFGKIVVSIDYDEEKHEVEINIKDSGIGLTPIELNNLQSPFTGQILHTSVFKRSGMTFYLCKLLTQKMHGSFSIKSSETIGTHYQILLPALMDQQTNEYPALLEDIYIRLNIHNADSARIVKRVLSNYGAEYLDIHESSPHGDWDLLLTDNDEIDFNNIIKINGNLRGIHKTKPNYIEVNYNFADELIDAISLLIENSELVEDNPAAQETLTQKKLTEPFEANHSIDDILYSYHLILSKTDYKDLFITTVPIDINKLYNSESVANLTELKNTAHRLKGVFAMLEFEYLHQLCEDLERFIADENGLEIKNCIRELDVSVKRLMPEGNQ